MYSFRPVGDLVARMKERYRSNPLVTRGYSIHGRYRPGLFAASPHVFVGARAWAGGTRD